MPELIGIEIDPLAALTLRANASALQLTDRLTLLVKDYRAIDLPKVEGATLYLGNPPYVRHHTISPRWKDWFAEAALAQGYKASKLAGLHIHFILKTRMLARPGDFGAFITSAEWLDVNYGAVMRRLLVNGLGGTALHVIAPTAMPFGDTAATGAIICFDVGHRHKAMRFRSVENASDLGSLASGQPVPWSRFGWKPPMVAVASVLDTTAQKLRGTRRTVPCTPWAGNRLQRRLDSGGTSWRTAEVSPDTNGYQGA